METSKPKRIAKRRRAQPSALAWPVGGIGNVNSNNKLTSVKPCPITDSSINATASHTKVRRHRNPSIRQNTSSQQWIDKYQPKSIKELCIASAKISLVQNWLESKYDKECIDPTKFIILAGATGIGKSTLIRVLAQELGYRILEWNESFMEYSRQGGYQSSIQQFQEFLDSVSFPYEAVSISDRTSAPAKKSLVLIDDLPHLHTQEQKTQFQHCFSAYIQKTQTLTVMIYSNGSEGKLKPDDLEEYMDPQILYSPLVNIIQINPVTKAKMKTCLMKIFQKEGIRIPSPDFFEEMHLKHAGDMRHAIMNLQFQYGSLEGKCWIGRNSTNSGVSTTSMDSRDKKLSTFHALGKILYAKRVDHVPQRGLNHEKDYHDHSWNVEKRPPLQFDAEKVLEESDIGIHGALNFVQFHSPDFFSEISDISQAFSNFSDAAYLLDSPYELRGSLFPEAYATSICGRTVGDTNKHPAPSKFRQLTAPKTYEVKRKQNENMIMIENICRRLTYREHRLALDVNVRSSHDFASNALPFIKRIIPEEVATFSSDIFSQRIIAIGNVADNNSTNDVKMQFSQQTEILKRDDIVDSSDDEDICNGNRNTSTDINDTKKNGAKVDHKENEPDIIIIE